MHTHQPIGTAARELVQRMGEAANNFLAALSTDQRAKAQLDFAAFGRVTRGMDVVTAINQSALAAQTLTPPIMIQQIVRSV